MPRKNGNTETLAQAFIEGAEAVGHKAALFKTRNKKLISCTACDTCFSKGAACTKQDDFNEVAPLIEKADVLVLATPLYWFSFSSQIKIIIDKMYSFNVGKKPLPIKEAVLLVCAENDDEKDFEGIIKSYELILNYKNWKNAGVLTVPNVNKAGDINKTDALERARKMGENL